ncbi:MAG: TauD/TfdA family dioxygenase [Alphaproteobacteria bacterium]
MRRAVNKGNQLWHTDSSFMDVRSAQSLLLAHEVPPAGGKTWFADTRTAYDDLPQAIERQARRLGSGPFLLVVAFAGGLSAQ